MRQELGACVSQLLAPLSSPQDDNSSVSSEEMNGVEPAWVAAEQPPVPEPSPANGERVSNTTANIKEEDGETPRSGVSKSLLSVGGLFTSGSCCPYCPGRVWMVAAEETACLLLLSGLIQINPLLQGVGHRRSPNPLCTPLSQGAGLREVGQRPILTFTA